MEKLGSPASEVLYIASTVLILISNVESTFVQFETHTNKKVQNEYREETTTDLVRCAALCAEDHSCLLASHSESDKSCLLSVYDVNGSNSAQQFITESSWTTLSKNKCFAGWVMIEESCYYFQENTKNYTDARNYCEAVSGKLAEPQTNTSSDLLRTYMAENLEGAGYWFGLNDMEVEDRFVWTSNGTLPSYASWSPADPNEGRDANCVEYFFSSGYKWADRACDKKRGSVCEML